MWLVGVEFQSTHPSGVRPARAYGADRVEHISIHAPQWGATSHCRERPNGRRISIHAPQWGATSRNHGKPRRSPRFQSTHPSGVRLVVVYGLGRPHAISIHAPQWGATCACFPTLVQGRNFNPRTPVGCDFPFCHQSSYRSSFQSTHPSGVRPFPSACLGLFHVFQSTHPSGVRRGYWRVHMDADLFQSTHPSGVRLALDDMYYHLLRISIHAPQWGATILSSVTAITMEFQSTHPSGVRRVDPIDVYHSIDISIHAPQWGATSRYPRGWTPVVFQSTHPSGVRPREWA